MHHDHPHHGHAHHDHGPAHGHGHSHGHAIPQEHAATRAPASRGGFSLIALSALQRLALAAIPVVLLWGITFWALSHG